MLPLAFGPLFAGPLSEVYGRSPIYRVSYIFFWIFSWPVAFAPHICAYPTQRQDGFCTHGSTPAVFLIFRFITGFCCAAFLSVAGGSVSDIFAGHEVAMYAYFQSLMIVRLSTWADPRLCILLPHLLDRCWVLSLAGTSTTLPLGQDFKCAYRFINQVSNKSSQLLFRVLTP